jgi:hypothetical protein
MSGSYAYLVSSATFTDAPCTHIRSPVTSNNTHCFASASGSTVVSCASNSADSAWNYTVLLGTCSSTTAQQFISGVGNSQCVLLDTTLEYRVKVDCSGTSLVPPSSSSSSSSTGSNMPSNSTGNTASGHVVPSFALVMLPMLILSFGL